MPFLHRPLLLFVAHFLLFSLAQPGSDYVRPAGAQTMTLKPPQMSEEESEGPNMPLQHQCDGCRAVVWEVGKAFRKAAARGGGKLRKLKESEVEDVLEEV